MKGETLNDKLEEIWKELQADVDHVMDRDKGNSMTSQIKTKNSELL